MLEYLLSVDKAQISAVTKVSYGCCNAAARNGCQSAAVPSATSHLCCCAPLDWAFMSALSHTRMSLPSPFLLLQSGNSALHRAAAYGSREAAESLLRAGAAVDARNADGATPLIRAARWGHDDVAAVLLAHGAQAAAADNAGRTAADWASNKGHNDVSALLAGGMRVIDSASSSTSSSGSGAAAAGHSAHALSISPANASSGSDHGPAPAAAAAGRPGLGGTAIGHLPSIGEGGDDDAEADAAEAAVAQYVLDEDGGAGSSAGADGAGADDFRTMSDLGDASAGDGFGFELGVPMHAEGWMAKQGQIFKTWKNRWFVLEGRCIYYYAREGAPKPKGVIVMSEGTDVIVEEKYAKPFCFTVATPAKRYILQAADEDEMAEWIEAIANNLECVPPGAVAGTDTAEDGEEDD